MSDGAALLLSSALVFQKARRLMDSRSPMAEAVLKHQIAERASLKGKYDFRIDSAGTGAYHAGDSADER
jgi:low molecular weight phosphotyrosine protein phosphatase